jgi:hypothetical protein
MTTVDDRQTQTGAVCRCCIDIEVGVYLNDYRVLAALCDGGMAEGEPMAREFTKLWGSLFTDRRFVDLCVFDKIVFVQLMGPSECNRAGVVRLSLRRWLRWLAPASEEQLKAALNRLERAGLVFIDPDTEEVFVCPYMEEDETYKQPWPMVNAFREMTRVHSPKIAAMLLEELDRFEIARPSGTSATAVKVRAALDAAERDALKQLNSLVDGAPLNFELPFPDVSIDVHFGPAVSESPAAPLTPAPTTRRGEPFSEPFGEPFSEGFAPRHAAAADTSTLPAETPGEPFSEGFEEGFEAPGPRHADGEPFGEPSGIGAGVLVNSPVLSGEIQEFGAHLKQPTHLRVAAFDTSPPMASCPDHPDGTNNPCRRCEANRKAHTREQARAHSERVHRDADAKRRAWEACPLGCLERRGYTPEGNLCTHDPEELTRPMPGRDQYREVLAAINDRVSNKRAAEPSRGNRADRRRRRK